MASFSDRSTTASLVGVICGRMALRRGPDIFVDNSRRKEENKDGNNERGRAGEIRATEIALLPI